MLFELMFFLSDVLLCARKDWRVIMSVASKDVVSVLFQQFGMAE